MRLTQSKLALIKFPILDGYRANRRWVVPHGEGWWLLEVSGYARLTYALRKVILFAVRGIFS